MRALNRDSGRELWQTPWAGAMSVPFLAKKNGDWIWATPACDGESLFVAGMRDVLVWNRRREPDTVGRGGRIVSALRADGVRIETFNGSQLFEPEAVKNQHGFPFQVFTAYWRTRLRLYEPAAPIPAPRRMPAPTRWPTSLPVGRSALNRASIGRPVCVRHGIRANAGQSKDCVTS
ncbi:MAG: deoxyribodipyrimidine photo-lyase [Phycisphaerae bacterium]